MALALSLAVPVGGAEPSAQGVTLSVEIQGARSSKGKIKLAICPAQSSFPDCKERTLRSSSLTIAGGKASAQFTGIPPGTYAISVFHDANENGKLDTFMGIPREGFGFSRNPPLRPRAPRFDEAMIQVSENSTVTINLRYLL
jgi:uncharacterized protein (DUF2141 family)